MKKLSKKKQKAFLNNLLKFSAPILAIFFGQLAAGMPIETALPVALYALYSAAADFMRKISESE